MNKLWKIFGIFGIICTLALSSMIVIGQITFDEADYVSEALMLDAARIEKAKVVSQPTLGTVTVGEFCEGEVDSDQCVVQWIAKFNNVRDGTVEEFSGTVVVNTVNRSNAPRIEDLVHQDVMKSFNSYKSQFKNYVNVKYRSNTAFGTKYDITVDMLTKSSEVVEK